MLLDLDTFLVALYTTVDDLYKEHFAPHKPIRPGPRCRLTDSEVLTLMICAQWLNQSERWVVAYGHQHWRGYFPQLLCQSATNRRVRDLAYNLVWMVPLVATKLEAEFASYQIFDTLPVPLMRKCRGRKTRLFYANEAGIGKGGSDKDWYYGCKLLVAATPKGAITGFVLGPAGTQERWLADALLCWRVCPEARPWEPADVPPANKRDSSYYVGPTGPIWPREGVGASTTMPYIVDGGFSGVVWTGHWAKDYAALVFTPESYKADTAQAMRDFHARLRHVVETVNEHLEHQFHLPFPRARTRQGLLARVAAKLAAFNLGILMSRLFGGPDFAFATLFSF